ncbi:MAG: phosphate ABC transporter permease subunit PstC [Deltaproteobacteria bacterium]|nr:phosphate ABC transporter permease subunit PstC [Deltaproteobacteria bacterium]
MEQLVQKPLVAQSSNLKEPSPRASRRENHGLRDFHWRQRFREGAIHVFLAVNGYLAIVLIGLIFLFLFKEGFHALQTIKPMQWIGNKTLDFDGREVFSFVWQPLSNTPKYSLLPLLSGSFLVALPATFFSTLIGIGCGVYLAELASQRTREILKPIVELLAGIPTVVIGFLALSVLATLVQNFFHTHFRLNAFVGALGVSLVIIPVIASMTEDALRAVPNELREASYGLGATRWETLSKVILPAGVSGISASILLGMGRALGETMIVLMATGNAALFTGNIFSSVRTMTATIASELGSSAQGSEIYYALFFVGSVLFTITFFINLISEVVVERMRRRLRL